MNPTFAVLFTLTIGTPPAQPQIVHQEKLPAEDCARLVMDVMRDLVPGVTEKGAIIEASCTGIPILLTIPPGPQQEAR